MIGKSMPRVSKLLGPYAAMGSNRNLALLFGGQVVSALGDWLYIATIAALATQTWHFGSQGSGFLLAAYGVGGLLGGFYVSALARRLRPSVAYAGSLAVSGLAMLLLGLSPAGLLPFALMVGFGSAEMLNQVVTTTLIQTSTPDALLGRVFGAFEAVLVSANLLGALATGPLLSWIGPRGTTLALSSATLIMMLLTLPRLRMLESGKRAAEPVASAATLVPAVS